MLYKCDKCGKIFKTKKLAQSHEKNCKGKEKSISKKLKINYSNFKQNLRQKKELREKERNSIKSIQKPINHWQFNKLSFTGKKNYVKEWFCECQSCGEKWYYLDTIEKKIKSQISANSCFRLSTCYSPYYGRSARNDSTKLEIRLNELRQCPKCKSSNATCEARYFKKE